MVRGFINLVICHQRKCNRWAANHGTMGDQYSNSHGPVTCATWLTRDRINIVSNNVSSRVYDLAEVIGQYSRVVMVSTLISSSEYLEHNHFTCDNVLKNSDNRALVPFDFLSALTIVLISKLDIWVALVIVLFWKHKHVFLSRYTS